MSERDLRYQFSADTDDFAAGARRVAGDVNKVSAAAQSMSVAVGGYFKGITGQMIGLFGAQQLFAKGLQQFDDAGAIAARSKAVQTTISRYQELAYTAQQTEARMEDYEIAMRTVNVRQVMALKGNEDLIKTFARLGVSVADLKTKSSSQIFDQIAAKQKGAEINTLLVGDATKVMGDTAGKVLVGMVEGFDDLAQAAREGGKVIDDEVVLRLAAAGDRMAATALQLKVAFAPVLDWLASRVSQIVSLFQWFAGGVGAFTGGFNGTTGGVGDKMSGGNAALQKFFDEWTNTERKREEDIKRQIAERAKPGQAPVIEDIGKAAADRTVREETRNLGTARTNVDSLTRIGGRRGGEVDASMNLMRQQKAALDRIEKATQESARHLRELAEGRE